MFTFQSTSLHRCQLTIMFALYKKLINTISEMRSYTDNKIHEIKSDGSFKYSILGSRGTRSSNVDSVIKNKEALISFDKTSIIKILSFNNRDGTHKIQYTSIQNATLPLFILSMLYLTVFITTNIFAARFIEIFGMVLPGGIYGFPLTFAILDIVTEYYGVGIARKIIYSAVFSMFVFVLLVSIYYYFGFLHVNAANKEYATLLDKSLYYIFFYHSSALYIVLSGSVAILLADTTNCVILSKLKSRWESKHLWLRCIIATSIGEVVFSLTWTTIYMFKTHILPKSDVLNAVVSQTILKSLYEVLALPATYAIIFFLRSIYGNENAARKAV
jgi:uncharacterized integral membrane protein (TIGR00697 family)